MSPQDVRDRVHHMREEALRRQIDAVDTCHREYFAGAAETLLEVERLLASERGPLTRRIAARPLDDWTPGELAEAFGR